jgi:hypothetical protein
MERANDVHQLLVSKMAEKLISAGIQPYYNGLIDLYCSIRDSYFIFEMKSITIENEKSQIRKAISQLYEYRFIHELNNSNLIIVLEKKPTESWIIEYLLEDRNIDITWLENGRFITPNGAEYNINKH